MLRAPLQRLYERLGPRYPRVVLAFVFLLSCFVVGGGVLLLNLYVDISLSTFWRIFAVSAVLVAIEVGRRDGGRVRSPWFVWRIGGMIHHK